MICTGEGANGGWISVGPSMVCSGEMHFYIGKIVSRKNNDLSHLLVRTKAC